MLNGFLSIKEIPKPKSPGRTEKMDTSWRRETGVAGSGDDARGIVRSVVRRGQLGQERLQSRSAQRFLAWRGDPRFL
eukprot:12916538-Prorocentrum_lima.AAC.1